jgi:putative hemolysin
MNDLLEQLVGDLGDTEPSSPEIEKKGNALFQVRGTCSLDKAFGSFGLPVPEGNFDTFGGFVFDRLGRVPADGEQCELETEQLSIAVSEIKDHRLIAASVRVG